jgi:hypothetical protein
MKPTNVPNMRRHVPFGINPTKKYSVWDYKFSVLYQATTQQKTYKKDENNALVPNEKTIFPLKQL